MPPFSDWCDQTEEAVKGHGLRLLTGVQERLVLGRDSIAAVIPTHYASEERLAALLEKLGKPKAAQFIRDKLPQAKRIRSGDLGEILATEFISEETSYTAAIKRLRWKDHRNMALRGDDVIGIRENEEQNRLEFLKSEIKSRVSLSNRVVTEARTALEKDNGLPSPHALTFVADRLHEEGNDELADKIDDVQLKSGILPAQVEHLLFAFCGNDPQPYLKADLEAYQGTIRQNGVGLRVGTHQEFIGAVYAKVIDDGDHD